MDLLEFSPAQHIQIAANGIEQLRETDVFRVLDECDAKNRPALIAYIKRQRVDLLQEVDECMEEIESDEQENQEL